MFTNLDTSDMINSINGNERRQRLGQERRGKVTIEIAICKQTFDKDPNTSLLRARFNLSEYQTS